MTEMNSIPHSVAFEHTLILYVCMCIHIRNGLLFIKAIIMYLSLKIMLVIHTILIMPCLTQKTFRDMHARFKLGVLMIMCLVLLFCLQSWRPIM